MRPLDNRHSSFTTHESQLQTLSKANKPGRRAPACRCARLCGAGRLTIDDLRGFVPALVAIILILIQWTAFAQTPPKRELRAAWIATVMNIDWPSQKGLSVARQQEEFVRLLDTLRQVGMNAVIVQVRPVADAFYPSSYEPWSEYLSGKQGSASIPYYNPLPFMIREARQRGLEFHAWFNPYRASMSEKLVYADDHPIRRHPEWFLSYGGKYYYDPGHPDAREYVLRSIMETVKHYDLDAVHFDDYFYPYRIANQEFPDSCSFAEYGKHIFENRDDWRRNNVDFFVEELSRRIRAEKPHLKFGISPFGVWRNFDTDSTGSRTQAGQTNYDDLFADVLKWLREGWIDYVTPQLYWHIGFEVADYSVLIDWWSKNTFGRHLYIGQGIYRIGGKGWEDPDELINQIHLNRTYDDVQGSMYFSARSFMQKGKGIHQMMHRIYPHKALVPVMSWLPAYTPSPPQLVRISGSQGEGLRIEWQDTLSTSSAYYAVYRFTKGDSLDIGNATHLQAVVPRVPYGLQSWVDHATERRTEYTYLATACDRLHNESDPGTAVRVKTRGRRGEARMLRTAVAPARVP